MREGEQPNNDTTTITTATHATTTATQILTFQQSVKRQDTITSGNFTKIITKERIDSRGSDLDTLYNEFLRKSIDSGRSDL